MHGSFLFNPLTLLGGTCPRIVMRADCRCDEGASVYVDMHACIVRWHYWQPLHLDGPSRLFPFACDSCWHGTCVHDLRYGVRVCGGVRWCVGRWEVCIGRSVLARGVM